MDDLDLDDTGMTYANRGGYAYAYIKRLRCPECGSVRIYAQSSIDNGDGSRTRYCRCRDCKFHLRVVVE